MGRTVKVSLVSLVVGVAGVFTGFASGAIGICGNGGWGFYAALLGFAGLLVFAISLPVMLVQLIYKGRQHHRRSIS